MTAYLLDITHLILEGENPNTVDTTRQSVSHRQEQLNLKSGRCTRPLSIPVFILLPSHRLRLRNHRRNVCSLGLMRLALVQ